MAGYRFTPEADADLFEIWSYIARDNPEAADHVEAAIYDACNRFAPAQQPAQDTKSSSPH